jgi:hypothetical protein
MRRPFKVYMTRFYNVLEDDFEYTYYAEDERDLTLLLVADLGGIPADDESEAKKKAEQFLDGQFGKGWTIQKLLESNLDLWKDNATLYHIIGIEPLQQNVH